VSPVTKLSGDVLLALGLQYAKIWFLADRTNGRAYATVLRLSSSVVCDVMYCG